MNLRQLESKYLKAKIAYYEGDERRKEDLLTDAEFDALEQVLKTQGSKVIEQVGAKRKDFDFAHPTKMLSLAKIQTEAREDGTTDYVEDQFQKWYQKNHLSLHLKNGETFGRIKLSAFPKFDGNAINIIYQGKNLTSVLTRGDGETGKDVTQRFLNHLPSNLGMVDLEVTDSDVIEIRAEVVIDINLFNLKYKGTREEGKFANARNYVAGVISKDDYDEVKVSELHIVPLHYLLNGKQISSKHFIHNAFFEDWDTEMIFTDYVDIVKQHEELRKTINYQLDGVVISFPVTVREDLGENDHDPEWALAVKFVPIETITEVEGIEWNISKRGELVPTLLLKPVFLDGSTVRRASGYNASYVLNNKLGSGAKVSIAKAGDIIPEIQKVITPSLSNVWQSFPTTCPHCGSVIEYDSVHLSCPNEKCFGRIAKQLTGALKTLDIMRIGEKTVEPFARDFENMYELIKWARTEGETVSGNIDQYGIPFGSRSHEIFIQAFKNIRSLTYEQVIQMLGYDNVGKKLSTQLSREHAGLNYDYAHLERALVAKLRSPEVSDNIKSVVDGLESLGITIDRPKAEIIDKGATGVCMTGSPKAFGFATKAEFLAKHPNLYEADLKDASFLVTDDLNSTSSKMKTAEKKGIGIKTYGDF
jgi:NAD-dependent DNA ligase